MNAVRLLVIGSGGREHAIVWRLAQDPRVACIHVFPSNAGIAQEPKTHTVNELPWPLTLADVPTVVQRAQALSVDYVVIGPEAVLALGLADALWAAGIATFGCTKGTAQLETSKAFAKDFMRAAGIAHALDQVFARKSEAEAFVRSPAFHTFSPSGACVVKFDGLAAGKGVVVCATQAHTLAAIDALWQDYASLDETGAKRDAFTLVLEECLTGREASVLAFCDGQTVRLMPPARDHKRLLDGDQGPNTGGMGVIAPTTDVSEHELQQIQARVFEPLLAELARRQMPYCGVIFVGLMWQDTSREADFRVLEFNCRFGDPETQVLLSLLETPLLEVIEACCAKRLAQTPVLFSKQSAVTVVLASEGYPEKPRTGDVIVLGQVQDERLLHSQTKLFHAATQQVGAELLTAGGRVLCATATGTDFQAARQAAYRLAHTVQFNGKQQRSDIGMTLQHNHTPSAYEASGVNIDEGNKAVELMKSAVKATYNKDVLAGIGAFGGMLSLSQAKTMDEPVLVASTDGVGTKTMIAQALGRWDSVGADLVNHSVNDVLVQGASPLFFMDYVATAKLDAVTTATIVGGMARACKESGCVLLGGETAEMPGVYHEGHWDIAGTIVGIVDKARALDGTRIALGDVLLGLPSSGLHTNGYSLARKALEGLDWTTPVSTLIDQNVFAGLQWRDAFKADANQSLGDLLLAVHRPYLKEYKALTAAQLDVHGMVHITGGGFVENIPRVLPEGLSVQIDAATINTPLIFELIALRGKVSREECFRVFNMGVGMVVFVAALAADKAQALLGEGAMRLGTVGPQALGTEQVVMQ